MPALAHYIVADRATRSRSKIALDAVAGALVAQRPVHIFEALTSAGSFFFATTQDAPLVGWEYARPRLPSSAHLQELLHIATVTPVETH